MRIAVDYRILAVGPYLMRRGMARYTQQQLRAVLDHDDESEFLLLCAPDTDLSLIDPEIVNAPNVELREMPESTQDCRSEGRRAMLRRAEHYQSWISRQNVDVFHATTPFLFAEPTLTTFDACPLVASLYDLIPLLYPDRYLDTPGSRDLYLYSVSLLMSASRLIAISQAAADDACHHLGIDRGRIDVAYPVADPGFRPMGPDEVADATARLGTRFRLPEMFALTVSYPHHSKNMDNFLAAYARLPASVRLRMPLVACCMLDRAGMEHVQTMASRLGIEGDLIVTGLVSDRELAALYNAATMVVHPSRYEGFGLPVVEAMRCRTPVVTTTASSLPEVAGDAAVLVDPDDVDGFTQAMLRLYEDSSTRDDMARLGELQAVRFDADQLALNTLEAYRRASSPGEEHTGPRRRRVALWSPLPPEPTGVADYAAELLSGLRDRCDVEVFVDDDTVPSTELIGRQPVHHFSAYERRHHAAAFDVTLFQMGASWFHVYMYEPLLHHGGVVALHDLAWSYVRYSYFQSQRALGGFRSELAQMEGPEAGEAFDDLNRRAEAESRADLPDASEDDFWANYPMLKDIVDATSAQIVHSAAAARELEQRYPSARPHVVPMGVADPLSGMTEAEMAQARDRAGCGPDTFVVGLFGIVHSAKRVEASLEALSQLVADGPDVLLLVVGRALDDEYRRELERLARRLGVSDHVRFTGPVSTDRFRDCLLACDAVVNLRSPSLRQTSATLMRSLAAGKPVIITDMPDWRAIPDECCLRIPSGDGELAPLVTSLRRLRDDPLVRAGMAKHARSYFEEEATVDQMVTRYIGVMDEVSATKSGMAGSRAVHRWDALVRQLEPL